MRKFGGILALAGFAGLFGSVVSSFFINPWASMSAYAVSGVAITSGLWLRGDV